MNLLGLVLFMGLIGAVIGGVTNAIAIRMLFRPHEARYFGNWRIPFTPGLIPKRRSELAKQVGKIVDEHLLTPESIKHKLSEQESRGEIVSFLQTEAKKFIHSDMTVTELLEKVHIKDPGDKVETKINEWIDQKYKAVKDFYIDQTVKESLPLEWLDKAEAKIPDVSSYILKKGVDYFSSEEGRYRVKRMTDDFLAEWGKFGGMIQMVLGNTSLEDKIRPEIIKFLNSPGTKELLDTVLKNEWDKVIEWTWADVLDQFSDERMVKKGKRFISGQLAIQTILDKPISAYAVPFEDKIIQSFIPEITDKGIAKMASRIPVMMQKLNIADIVRQQIETFSIARLEKIVLDIAHRELKMITWLGALLGGLIGILQAIIMMAFPT
ncbi:DUF445 domain-containing protein [Domibacillus epiphyticus]|uniref:DUF445 domain-containing protein n=1 Tax=Domibacillus epiphyticus TaxID=1714355 RepID=A0A1V2A819_9BACI|nr:DUF445 family protein [Domibacillus epiphyticus]OMP67143.1 hypothetical protein BTO28_09185 [Domibacillus epiphyticus]